MIRPLCMALLLAAPDARAQDPADDDLPEADAPLADEPPPETEASGGESAPDDEPFTIDDEADDADSEATAAYRALLNRLLEAEPEERMAAWEAYLQEHPDTPFREQVRKHIAEAEAELYGEGIRRGDDGPVDKRAIPFPETLVVDNPNPSTRFRGGFEFGLPEWINVFADAEYAVGRQFSGHLGMRKRSTGWTLEMGPRLAVVKIPEPGVVLTVAGDLQVGVDPAILGLRPMFLAALRPVDRLFVEAMVGPSWELNQGVWSPRLRTGGYLGFRAAEPVALYVEGATESKFFGWPGGDLQFHTVGFGMRFYPVKQAERPDPADVVLGAAVPAYYNYPNYLFHQGAASVQASAYLE